MAARGLALVEAASAVDETSPGEVMSGAAGIVGPLLSLHARYAAHTGPARVAREP